MVHQLNPIRPHIEVVPTFLTVVLPQEVSVQHLSESKLDPVPHTDALQSYQNSPRVEHQLVGSNLEVRDNLSHKSGYWKSETRLKGKLIEALPSLNVLVYPLMRVGGTDLNNCRYLIHVP